MAKKKATRKKKATPKTKAKARAKAANKKNGRPTKMTEELVETIATALRAGNYVDTAAAFAGIARSTFYDWMRKGAREEEGPFREFSDTIKRAIAVGESKLLATIGSASVRHWQAAAWMLERRFPAKWGRKLKLDFNSMTDEQLIEFITRTIAGDESAGTD